MLSALMLIGLAALPPLRGWLEAGMTRHVLMQFPLLVGGGVILGRAAAFRQGGRDAARGAAAGLLLAVFTTAFWLVPRWLDAAVGDPHTGNAKIVSLVLLAGLPLGWGWVRAGVLLRTFLWANMVPMLGVMGWAHLSFPVRLCNNYLLREQYDLGRWLIAISLALLLAGGAAALRGQSSGKGSQGRPFL